MIMDAKTIRSIFDEMFGFSKEIRAVVDNTVYRAVRVGEGKFAMWVIEQLISEMWVCFGPCPRHEEIWQPIYNVWDVNAIKNREDLIKLIKKLKEEGRI